MNAGSRLIGLEDEREDLDYILTLPICSYRLAGVEATYVHARLVDRLRDSSDNTAAAAARLLRLRMLPALGVTAATGGRLNCLSEWIWNHARHNIWTRMSKFSSRSAVVADQK